MKSIKLKLVIGIILILSILMSGIIIYGVSFKGYFQKQKLHEMKDVIVELENNIENEPIDTFTQRVGILADEYNVQIDVESVITGKTICATHSQGKNSMMNGMGGKNKFETLQGIGENDGIVMEVIHDKSTGVKFLTSTKLISDDEYSITVKTPINIMDDAVSKSLNLLMIIFIPITGIVLLLTVVFANGFTKPIIQITKKTRSIKALDFTEELKAKGKDEISELANCVNSLSDKIKSTLEEVNNKNSELEAMIEKERENEIIRREFVSSVSHELKSPIAVISGYTQMLNEGIITSQEDVKYYLTTINEESDRMNVIVSDLLDLYKLESNTFKLEKQEIDLGVLVNKIAKKNAFRFHELGVNVTLDIKNAMVIADEIRLEQAIQNYINNALSHVDDKKELRITVTEDAEIKVFNSGKHIEEENIEKIWQGFVRLDKVRNYKEKRVGLGLAIVKQIVKLHNGECGVCNKENGVEFFVKLSTIDL